LADIKETSTRATFESAFKKSQQEFPDGASEEDFLDTFRTAVDEDPETGFLSANNGLLVVGELMLNENYYQSLLDMEWWTVDLSRSEFTLITCDRPYMVFRSLSHPRGLLYLPIGPHLAFFASRDPNKKNSSLASPPIGWPRP
jgi:hypothetical protein